MAHAIAFFLDRESGFISGQALMVCGGSSLGNRESYAPEEVPCVGQVIKASCPWPESTVSWQE